MSSNNIVIDLVSASESDSETTEVRSVLGKRCASAVESAPVEAAKEAKVAMICPICLYEPALMQGQPTLSLGCCNNVYHFRCLQRACERKRECPSCRAETNFNFGPIANNNSAFYPPSVQANFQSLMQQSMERTLGQLRQEVRDREAEINIITRNNEVQVTSLRVQLAQVRSTHIAAMNNLENNRQVMDHLQKEKDEIASALDTANQKAQSYRKLMLDAKQKLAASEANLRDLRRKARCATKAAAAALSAAKDCDYDSDDERDDLRDIFGNDGSDLDE